MCCILTFSANHAHFKLILQRGQFLLFGLITRLQLGHLYILVSGSNIAFNKTTPKIAAPKAT